MTDQARPDESTATKPIGVRDEMAPMRPPEQCCVCCSAEVILAQARETERLLRQYLPLRVSR